MNSRMWMNMRPAGVAACVGFLLIGWWPQESHGQITPEFAAAARGVFSANYENKDAGNQSAVSDFSDTGLLMGLRQKLYSGWRSRFVLGMQFPDADSRLGQIFYHQAFIQVEDRSNIVKIGRSRLQGTLIEFPTLRDDDALFLTDILNPFTPGENSEDSQFGNVLEYTRFFGQRIRLTGHGEHYTEMAPADPDRGEDFGLNSVGTQLEYRVPRSQRWNRDVLQHLGVGINTFFLDEQHLGAGRKEAVTSAVAAIVLNIRPDPVDFWDFRAQTIYNSGLDGVNALDAPVDLARARSMSLFASLRYLKRNLERPSCQAALSGGYKIYPDLDTKTDQWQVVGNVAIRLGEGFDVVAQAQYERQKGDLVSVLGTEHVRVQLGFVYGFERVFNAQFGDRESLLNLEHGYIP